MYPYFYALGDSRALRARCVAARELQMHERDAEMHARRAADMREWQVELDSIQ